MPLGSYLGLPWPHLLSQCHLVTLQPRALTAKNGDLARPRLACWRVAEQGFQPGLQDSVSFSFHVRVTDPPPPPPTQLSQPGGLKDKVLLSTLLLPEVGRLWAHTRHVARYSRLPSPFTRRVLESSVASSEMCGLEKAFNCSDTQWLICRMGAWCFPFRATGSMKGTAHKRL